MFLTAAIPALLVLLLLSIPVAATLAALGLLLGWQFSSFPLYRAIGEVSWATSTDFLLVAIPIFVLLGEILLRAGIAERTYNALDKWLSWLPGGLMHANIMTSAMFAATSGSSVATAATISTVAIPQARKNNYNEDFFAGSIAAGGTLGILIPPSINLIIYGFLTNTSIPRLFLAGIVPGILLTFLFMLFIVIACLIWPTLAGGKRSASWQERISTLKDLIPVCIIFIVVIGSIYTGLATPTESAALGVIAALILTVAYGKFSLGMLRDAIEGTMRTNAMIMLILLAAYFLNFVLSAIGLTEKLTTFVNGLGMTPMSTLLTIVCLYVVLGFFIETLSLMVITIPIVAPVIIGMGYDPVWFGVLLILLIEMALITPPVGLNLYVVQGVRKSGNMTGLMIGSSPFVVMMGIMVVVLILFPDLALILAKYVN
jgi:tripartite ATP-independent transporter DctM subunit